MFRRFRKLWRNQDGSLAVEFAFAAPILVTVIFGIAELAMALVVSSLIEGGLRDAARFGITGREMPGVTREAVIRQIIQDATGGLVDMSTAQISSKVYPSFVTIGTAEPFEDANGNATYDDGENFTDINGNGQWDSDMGVSGAGGPGDIVLYTIRYDLPLLTPLLGGIFGGDGFKLSASIPVRNEPF